MFENEWRHGRVIGNRNTHQNLADLRLRGTRKMASLQEPSMVFFGKPA